MNRGVTGGKTLPAEVVQQIVAKTDGVPLFVEELTKMVLESGLLQKREERYELTGLLPPLAIPATLHDSLMARLDRLATVKEVVQLAATLGRTFAYELLRAVAPLDEATLQQALARLVEAELLYQRGVPPPATYIFKHALIQDAAYQSLLRSTRQQYHQRIAQVLEAQFAELVETQPELLAHHYTEASLSGQAIGYWQRAGQQAIERSAHLEAVSHLTKGLEVLKALPETPERLQHELTLCLALGTPLIATKGMVATEVEHVFSRARELCSQGGDTAYRFRALMGLFVFYEMRGALRIAHELTQELLTLAQNQPETVFLLRACAVGGQTFFLLGDLASARTTFEQGIAVYDPQQHRPQVQGTRQDAGVTCLSYVSRVLWLQGYPDQDRVRSHNARTLSEELSHPYTKALASYQAGALHIFLREGPQAQEQAEMVLALATEHGFMLWSALGPFLRGWAQVTQGHTAGGMEQLCQGLDAHRATGAEMALPHFLALLAEALAVVEKNAERWWEAELYRLKGELLLQRAVPDAPQAEACFQQALTIARHQQAKSLELRAVMSLSRLWQRQGKRDAARELLAPVYGWFTEGFDTADL